MLGAELLRVRTLIDEADLPLWSARYEKVERRTGAGRDNRLSITSLCTPRQAAAKIAEVRELDLSLT
jgi:hypothetical protein